jgi:Uma2 family endonuclease
MATADIVEAEVISTPSPTAHRSIPDPVEQEGANGDQRIDLWGISYDLYSAINDAVGEKPGVRMIYSDGRLTFLSTSRKHDWYAERLAEIVKALANRLEIPWDDAGQATFKSSDKNAGIEGDKTYYFREHAIQMSGPVNIDLTTQPPPDLAIEIVVSYSAKAALKTWGRLGVPEVWTYNPIRRVFAIWSRAEDGSYVEAPTSLGFPGLTSDDLRAQMMEAEERRASDWFKQIAPWCETIALRPKP